MRALSFFDFIIIIIISNSKECESYHMGCCGRNKKKGKSKTNLNNDSKIKKIDLINDVSQLIRRFFYLEF